MPERPLHVPATLLGNALLTVRSRRIINSNRELQEPGLEAASGDIICCRLRLKYEEEHLLLDLVERGVILIPSATSQLASRSKTFQARILAPFMIPHTRVIYDIHGLLETVSLYGRNNIEKVVLKHDRKNAGLGIHLFRDIEDVYTQAANNVLPFPFVLQPFVEGSRDVRVIIIGTYIEAYERSNPDNFRNNLHCGGNADPVSLSPEQLDFCRRIMERGGFPYAHLDLMLTGDNETYLAEINLRGGIRGAAIDPGSYRDKVRALENRLLETVVSERE